jgi:hypothetical protein
MFPAVDQMAGIPFPYTPGATCSRGDCGRDWSTPLFRHLGQVI